VSCNSTEDGGSETNPEHEPHMSNGGIIAEMQVCRRGRGVMGERREGVWIAMSVYD